MTLAHLPNRAAVAAAVTAVTAEAAVLAAVAADASSSPSISLSQSSSSSSSFRSFSIGSILLLIYTMLLLAASLLLAFPALEFLRAYWFHPRRLRAALEKQGLRGPPPRFMVGNMVQVSEMREAAASEDMKLGDHNLLPRICPHLTQWSKAYGKRFLFWWGTEARITVVEPELIKEILCTKAEHFGKSMLQKKGGVLLLGNGLVYANGESWAHRRRIVGPAFHVEKLKGMVADMTKSTSYMLDEWSRLAATSPIGTAEIDINYYLSMATADVIARTAFGSGHEKGKRVFELLTRLQKVFAQSNRYLWLPCSRLLPTAVNKSAAKMKRDIEEALQDLVQKRRAGGRRGGSYGDDFLGLMLSESEQERLVKRKGFQFDTSELVEECKTIFFTGHETTSALLTWTLMLLALHPEWQERGRAEALEHVPRGHFPDSETLSKLKTLGMILNETLRLYPPAPALVRECLDDIELCGISIPKGTTFWIPILAVHHDEQIWGPEATKFRPERFSEGVAKACKQMQFIPFSFGPRACVGQTFAMMEAKVVLAMILQRFKFTISPSYRHAPVTAITLKPKYGMQLLVSEV